MGNSLNVASFAPWIYVGCNDKPQYTKRKRLIFVASAGRCGTGYLAQLLATAENTWSEHEPHPKLAEAWLVQGLETSQGQFIRPDRIKMRKALKKKQQAIKSRLKRVGPGGTLVETTHMFLVSM